MWLIVKVIMSYYDVEKHRNIGQGEAIEVSESRARELEKAWVIQKEQQKRRTRKRSFILPFLMLQGIKNNGTANAGRGGKNLWR